MIILMEFLIYFSINWYFLLKKNYFYVKYVNILPFLINLYIVEMVKIVNLNLNINIKLIKYNKMSDFLIKH